MINAMYPILARYGSIFIYSYTVVIAIGIIVSIGLISRSTQHSDTPDWFDALLLILAAGLLTGRFGFVLWRWDYLQERPMEAWQIWRGGLSYYSALLAGTLALVVWAAMGNRSFYRYAALFTPALVLVTAFGWAACLLEGCAYGRETVLSPWSADLPDEFGVYAVRYQTQLAGILLALIVFLIILWYQKDHPYSRVFWLAIVLISLTHLSISLLRGDPTLIVHNLRWDTLISALLVAVSLLLLQYERLMDN